MRIANLFKSSKQKELDTTLLHAIHAGAGGIAMELLEQGADANAADGDMPAIILAAAKKMTNVVAALLSARANANAVGTDKEGKYNKVPVLGVAASVGSLEIVQLLLGAGAKVDMADANGVTPLMMASAAGHADVGGLLITRCANIDQASNTGYTPLLFAAHEGQKATLRMLLSRGAVVDRADKEGNTPLLVASKMGHAELVTLLLQNSADPQHKNLHGHDALYIARDNSRLEVLDVFKAMR